ANLAQIYEIVAKEFLIRLNVGQAFVKIVLLNNHRHARDKQWKEFADRKFAYFRQLQHVEKQNLDRILDIQRVGKNIPDPQIDEFRHRLDVLKDLRCERIAWFACYIDIVTLEKRRHAGVDDAALKGHTIGFGQRFWIAVKSAFAWIPSPK